MTWDKKKTKGMMIIIWTDMICNTWDILRFLLFNNVMPCYVLETGIGQMKWTLIYDKKKLCEDFLSHTITMSQYNDDDKKTKDNENNGIKGHTHGL